MVKKLLFNYSGHPLPSEPKGYLIKNFEIPTADLNTPKKVVDTVTSLLKPAYEEYKDEILKGQYEIVLPGMSVLSTSFLVVLHGLSGHFPTIRYIYRIDSGFKLSEPFDLQKVRLTARDSRFFQSSR